MVVKDNQNDRMAIPTTLGRDKKLHKFSITTYTTVNLCKNTVVPVTFIVIYSFLSYGERIEVRGYGAEI